MNHLINCLKSTKITSGSIKSTCILFRSYSSTTTPTIDYNTLIPENGNIPKSLLDKIGKNLHSSHNHPLNIIKKKIQYHFQSKLSNDQVDFQFFDDFHPRVSVKSNFDELLFPKDHVGRSPNDTYYFNKNQVLRTHTSAHQNDILRDGNRAFLVTGDVYRRDEIDAVHYPAFHQMEGLRVFSFPSDGDKKSHFDPSINFYENQEYKNNKEVKIVEEDLKRSLESMIRGVIGQDLQVRWVDAYFPFTSPSWEMEILFNGKWLEVLGCGVVHPEIMHNTGLGHDRAWAFGIGLERLAMILFDIPDIRLFWTEDSRFHDQFKGVDKSNPSEKGKKLQDIDIKNIKFQPYSKYPSCFKDISFWIGDDFHSNKFFEFVRECCGDLVENVELVDNFTNPKTNKTSQCYRIHYRSMERNLTNEEIDQIQFNLRDKIESSLDLKLR
ncbi:hypothetical protein CYY_008665 [Polysphondylium violaceum]|uniref:phenylalanine--tRNA ligase n=1 Tax=Polysphondylium violaceum TaxID=133409 RepID=A0A8J4UQ14_9MYCE|nr:hypothetical protein CYY_008665 [Polysphondylium violaceum]